MNEPENVVKISHHREPYTFYERAAELLLDKTFNFNTIYLKAIGNAIPTALYVAEFLHRRVDGLHQVSDITRTSFTEEYEAIEEGLENKTLTRYVSTLSIKLTTEPAEEDYKSPGYQGPLESDEKQIKHLLQISKTVAHIRDRQEGGRYNRSGRRGDNRGDRSRISERRGYQHNLGEDSDGDNRQDREQGYKKRFPNEEWSPRSRGNRGVFRIFGPKEDHDRRREGSRDGENRRDGEREDKDFVRRGSGRVFVADRQREPYKPKYPKNEPDSNFSRNRGDRDEGRRDEREGGYRDHHIGGERGGERGGKGEGHREYNRDPQREEGQREYSRGGRGGHRGFGRGSQSGDREERNRDHNRGDDREEGQRDHNRLHRGRGGHRDFDREGQRGDRGEHNRDHSRSDDKEGSRKDYDTSRPKREFQRGERGGPRYENKGEQGGSDHGSFRRRGGNRRGGNNNE